MMRFCILILLALLVALAAIAPARADDDDAQAAEDATKIEILKRLDNIDVNASEKLSALVHRYLNRNKDTEEYVDVVERFNIADAHAELAHLVATRPTDNVGVRAARVLVHQDDRARLTAMIDGKDATACDNAITALGLVGDKAANDFLLTLVKDEARTVPVRGSAVRALGVSSGGQKALLHIVESNEMPELLKPAFTQTLNGATDPAIRAAAAKTLPMPATRDARPLPPISDLIKRQGDASKGPELFVKGTCVQCHRVGDQGADFGPNLSEIASKLPRDAIYVSILDPSAGIGVGFEASYIETDDGSTYIGIITSDADGVVVLKQQQGIVQKIKVDAIVERRRLPTSVMPVGLTAALTTDELVDLVEWLTTLKKAK